jgi:hypothetical protein
MHLKPTAGCQISTLIFGFGDINRDPLSTICFQISKLIFDTLSEFKSKVLPGPLTDLSA